MADIIITHQMIKEMMKNSQCKKLLSENGYIVKKATHSMEQDTKECEEKEERG